MLNYFLLTYGWKGSLWILTGIVLNGVCLGYACRVVKLKMTPIQSQAKPDNETGCGFEQEFEKNEVFQPNDTDQNKTRVTEGLYIPSTFIPPLAHTLGIDPTNAALLVSVMGIANIVSRVIVGILSDQPWADNFVINGLAAMVAGVATSVVPLLKTYSLLAAYCAVFGFCTGENRDVTKVKKRQLRKTAAKYTIREDVLYHDGILVAKRNQVPEILQEFHDNYVSGGHLGMNKTYKKVLERYFWHGMKQEVEDYCRSCCVCQNMNACRKKPAAPLHPIPVPKKKWSLVGMDIIGPLQVTDRGNQYIVALTDHFTKFPVAKAIPCKSSEEVARFMYETICIFGAFDSLITDQGREFINFALDILTDRFNINHRISSAYHPETNGQRERDNRTLKDTLAKLPFDVTGDANEQDLNEEIMDTMKGIHEEVKNKIGENISRAQKKQKEYYDSRRAYDHGLTPPIIHRLTLPCSTG
nr:hypothetical protein BaRGS_017184 [Batillaria attramentaria]